jgi:hypothetical protein
VIEETPSYPKCFDSQERFDLWKNTARMTPLGIAGYCADCNPKHKALMLRHSRCENPTVMFELNSEGDTVGFLPEVKRPLIPVTENIMHKWLRTDEQSSVKYLGPTSAWHPVPGTFDRIPTAKKESKKL